MEKYPGKELEILQSSNFSKIYSLAYKKIY